MDRPVNDISKESQLWVEIGPNQKSSAFKPSILEKSPFDEVEHTINEDQFQQSEDKTEDGSKMSWILEVEIAKVIEQGVALGYDFNRRNREEESAVESEYEERQNARSTGMEMEEGVGQFLNGVRG